MNKGNRGRGGGGMNLPQRRTPMSLYYRAQEAVEYLIECDGLWLGDPNEPGGNRSKNAFAIVMSQRKGRAWLNEDGTGNRRLVEEVCNLTRDQRDNETAREFCGGYVITYAPSLGGMSLFDPSSKKLDEMGFHALIHLLAGDLQRQEAAKTVNRRRTSNWNAVGHMALTQGNADLGRICFQCEHDIESSGIVQGSLVADFLRLVQDLEPRS